MGLFDEKVRRIHVIVILDDNMTVNDENDIIIIIIDDDHGLVQEDGQLNFDFLLLLLKSSFEIILIDSFSVFSFTHH